MNTKNAWPRDNNKGQDECKAPKAKFDERAFPTRKLECLLFIYCL